MPALDLDGAPVRIDKDTGYFCLTDMAKLKDADASRIIGRWMRTSTSIQFFQAWERRNATESIPPDFGGFKARAGENTFSLSTRELVEAGATGIFAKRGRYGGTYAHIDWAIHFANWLDPDFYVLTIAAFRKMNDLLVGREHLELRFSRELAAKNYGLVTGGGGLERIPHVPLPPGPKTANFKRGNPNAQISRRLSQFDADTINLALWGMTAGIWRQKFPGQKKHGNMRNLATTEELQVLTALQAQTRQLQKEQYNQEEKLHILAANAAELIPFFCDTAEKERALLKRREERGW